MEKMNRSWSSVINCPRISSVEYLKDLRSGSSWLFRCRRSESVCDSLYLYLSRFILLCRMYMSSFSVQKNMRDFPFGFLFDIDIIVLLNDKR